MLSTVNIDAVSMVCRLGTLATGTKPSEFRARMPMKATIRSDENMVKLFVKVVQMLRMKLPLALEVMVKGTEDQSFMNSRSISYFRIAYTFQAIRSKLWSLT